MAHRIWETAEWFAMPLCIRYLVVHFGKLPVRASAVGSLRTSEWHWALALHADGGFDVLGAWPDQGSEAAKLMAADLRARGLVRLNAVAADDEVLQALGDFHPTVCRNSLADLNASGVLSPRMQQAVQWTASASEEAQKCVERAIRRQRPPPPHDAAADVLSQAFQRMQRDLFEDGWKRSRPARYGSGAAPSILLKAERAS